MPEIIKGVWKTLMSKQLDWYTKVSVDVEDILAMIRGRYETPPENPYPSTWFETEEEATEYAVLTKLKSGRECKVYHRDVVPDTSYDNIRQLLKRDLNND